LLNSPLTLAAPAAAPHAPDVAYALAVDRNNAVGAERSVADVFHPVSTAPCVGAAPQLAGGASGGNQHAPRDVVANAVDKAQHLQDAPSLSACKKRKQGVDSESPSAAASSVTEANARRASVVFLPPAHHGQTEQSKAKSAPQSLEQAAAAEDAGARDALPEAAAAPSCSVPAKTPERRIVRGKERAKRTYDWLVQDLPYLGDTMHDNKDLCLLYFGRQVAHRVVRLRPLVAELVNQFAQGKELLKALYSARDPRTAFMPGPLLLHSPGQALHDSKTKDFLFWLKDLYAALILRLHLLCRPRSRRTRLESLVASAATRRREKELQDAALMRRITNSNFAADSSRSHGIVPAGMQRPREACPRGESLSGRLSGHARRRLPCAALASMAGDFLFGAFARRLHRCL
jgi:hypothetical protein